MVEKIGKLWAYPHFFRIEAAQSRSFCGKRFRRRRRIVGSEIGFGFEFHLFGRWDGLRKIVVDERIVRGGRLRGAEQVGFRPRGKMGRPALPKIATRDLKLPSPLKKSPNLRHRERHGFSRHIPFRITHGSYCASGTRVLSDGAGYEKTKRDCKRTPRRVFDRGPKRRRAWLDVMP